MRPTDTEPVLLQQAAAGDRQAFGRLYVRYLNDLCRYVHAFTRSKETAEEIVQEIFVKLWEKKEVLAAVHSFGDYVFHIAKNRVIDHIRSRQLKFKIIKRISAEAGTFCIEADHKLLFDDYYHIATEAISRLPAKRKLIFRLHNEEYLSLDEIAAKLGISKSVVKKQLYAATAYVKQYLHDHAELTVISVILLFLL